MNSLIGGKGGGGREAALADQPNALIISSALSNCVFTILVPRSTCVVLWVFMHAAISSIAVSAQQCRAYSANVLTYMPWALSWLTAAIQQRQQQPVALPSCPLPRSLLGLQQAVTDPEIPFFSFSRPS